MCEDDNHITQNVMTMIYQLVGLVIAGFLCFLFIMIAGLLIYADKYVAGTLFGATPVIMTLLGMFITREDKNTGN